MLKWIEMRTKISWNELSWTELNWKQRRYAEMNRTELSLTESVRRWQTIDLKLSWFKLNQTKRWEMKSIAKLNLVQFESKTWNEQNGEGNEQN